MTTNKLRKLIDEAVECDRVAREKAEELKALKEALKAEAASREEEHTPTAGGGWSWEFAGESGAVCRVTQEGDKLKASVSAEKEVAVLKEVCGPQVFRALFEPGVVFRTIPKLRLLAEELLSKTACKKLLKALTTRGSVKVGFEVKGGES